jgi:signal transduction histidine kinase
MAASHAAVLAVILLGLGLTGLVLLQRSLSNGVTQDLLDAAHREVDRVEEAGRLLPPPDSDVPSSAATRIAVFDAGGMLAGEPEAPTWLRPSATRVRELQVSGERVRIVTLRATSGGTLLGTVVAGRSLAPEERLLARVRLLLLAGGGVAIALSLLAGWGLSGLAARPVERAYAAQAGFAADASHELRSPLAFVRSGVEVLAEHDRELGAQVLSEVDYLTALTGRLLGLARAERGQTELERAPFDLAEVARAAARRSEAAGRTALDLEVSPARALGDRVATEAVLDALLENVAVHGGGSAQVRVRAEHAEATVRVMDRGPGIPPEMGERVFERFARADPSRARDTGGAGLGLALARALVRAQGGRISLGPTPGGGLTVTVSLPAS